MAGKEPESGPTAKTVAENVARLRTAQKMNYKQLSDTLLARANWSINAVGIRRIESGERRVTVDDLMALSVALGVSPSTLIYPDADDAGARVSATGLPQPENARVLWEWVSASMWAYWALEHVGGFTKPSDFFRRAWPQWMLQDLDGPNGSTLDFYDSTWAESREQTRKRQLEREVQAPDGDDQ
ncbi:helix-turn-helix domain-containing protein [Mycobacterium sp. WMMD1722]|uniref:helix-turn-helix domain-containing protein n=1 Tax=Mycobacterium sp. WMMD1722 TaxID=3404117 RepID=UPI003BF49B7A